MTLDELKLEAAEREAEKIRQIQSRTPTKGESAPFPAYNIEKLQAQARKLIQSEGGKPDAVLVYHLIARLRSEELREYRERNQGIVLDDGDQQDPWEGGAYGGYCC